MDNALFHYLNSWAGRYSILDTMMIFKAEYLGWFALGGLGVFLVVSTYFHKDEAKVRFMVLTALFAGIFSRFVVTEVIRLFYDRPRPFEVVNGIYQLVTHPSGGSFPSGHAAFFFALAAGVFIFYRGLGALFFAFALAIGTTRVIAGVHWPSDILGGAIVGIISAYFVYYLLSIYTNKTDQS